MAKKKIIAYDLDGTLVDTRRDIGAGVNYMLGQMGKPPLPQREIELSVGEGLNYLVSAALKEKDIKIVERGARYLRQYYEEHLLDFTELYPLAQNVLDYFSEQIQIVVTNKPEPFTSRILNALGVTPYLADVFTGEGGIPRKPDPAALLYSMKKNRILAQDVLWVGDSVVDIQTGKNAGVETVIVRHGFASALHLEDLGPDYLVDNFEQFLNLAQEKGW